MTDGHEHTSQNVQKNVHDPVQRFKDAYMEILAKAVERRKNAGITQDHMANMLGVDRRKIIDMEAGKIKVGLLLRYADLLDIDVKLGFTEY